MSAAANAGGLTVLDEVVRFVTWAHELPAFPTNAQVCEQFGVPSKQAQQWRASLARAHGIALPGAPKEPSP